MFRKLRKYFFFLIFLMLGNFCLLSGQSIYYSKSSQATNLENISAWSDTQNELGVSPIDFSNPDDIYVIDDPNATIGADWDVSGVIFVGDGSVSASFSVPQSFGITSYIIIDVLGPSTVNWASSSIPQIGFLDDNSWVHYNRNGNQNILAGFNYPNLRISGSGIKTYSVNLTVDFHLLIESGAQLAIPAVSSRSLTLNGSISGTGTLRGGNTFAASIGSLNIIGSGNLGTLYFTPTAQVIRNFNLNRTGTTVFLGNDLSLQLNASIAGGVLDIQNNRLTVNSLLGISSSNFQSGANGTVAYSNTLAGVTQTIAGLSYGNLTYSNSNKFFTNRLISVAGLFSPGTANGHSSTGSTFLFSGVDGQSIPGFNFVNLSFLNGNKNFSNSVISISGVFAPNNIFQNTITGSTFLYVGANVPLQTVAGFAYNNLTIRNNKQLSPSNTISIAGIYVITAAGTITTTNSTVEFNGATNQTIPATFYHNLLSTNLGGRALPNTGSITIRGNFVPGTNIYTITGSTIAFGGATGQTIPGFNYFNLSCPGGGLNRVLGTNTTIGIAGTFTTGTTNYSSLGSTVNYNGSIAQAVRAIPYFNLIASNTNTKTVASGTVVNGNVSVVGAAQMAFNTGSYQFNGDIFTNNSGNFNLANGNRVLSLSGVNSRIIINSTVNPSFAGNTSITGSYTINSASIPINFARLQLRNSVPSTICLSLSGLNTQISTSLNLTSGRIATGNAAIVITTGGIVTGGSVASYIQGNLIRRFSASPNNVQSFPIGTAMAYAPARLTVPGLATAGNLRMSTNDGDAPNISTAGFSIRINRNWSTSNFGITPTTCIGWLGYDVNDYTGDFSLFNRLAVSSTTGWRLSTLSGISATMATISGARNIISLSGICQIGRIGSVPGITNWIGAVNTDWFNVGNWSNGLPSTSIDAVINTVVGINYPLITTTGAVSKNITITGNANLSLAGINGLYLNGNFINNGSFYPQNGIINISGTGVSISGVSVTTFYNLSVVGNTNLVLGQGINIQNTFYLGSSTASITTNGFPFVILSNASGTGRIGVVPMGAAINGNITVQRYLKPTFAPTSRLFYHLATPVNGTTVGEWQNSFYISGFFSFPSVNTATGITAGSSASLHIYNPLTALFTAYPTSTSADPISVGTGYRAFIRDGSAALSPNTSAKTITVTGTPIIGNHAFTGLNYTVVGTSGGWNFIGNPYAAEIYGDLTDVSKWPIRTNINPAVYTWNPEGRCYNSFISGVATSCAPSTSTFTGVISSSQGFWVQASAAAPNLTVSENAKTTSGGNFYRQGRMEELLYVRLNSNLYSNEIAVRFEDLSSKLYDNEFDAYKLETGSGQGGASPLLISSLINNKTQALSIDTRPNLSVSQSDTVYFNIVSPNGSDTIRFLGKESFNPSMQILLLDFVNRLLYF
jgi:hypothetical protein